MTMPHYLSGCPAEFQVPGIAPSPSDAAWNVNFNNGNSNWNNHNNECFARAVRARQ